MKEPHYFAKEPIGKYAGTWVRVIFDGGSILVGPLDNSGGVQFGPTRWVQVLYDGGELARGVYSVEPMLTSGNMDAVEREAEARYPRLAHPGYEDPKWGGTGLQSAYTSDDLQEAYMAGASRIPSHAEVERAARKVSWLEHCRMASLGVGVTPDDIWRGCGQHQRDEAVDTVHAVIEALRETDEPGKEIQE